MPTNANITSEQIVETGVAGPDDVERMFIVSGIARVNFSVEGSGGESTQTQRETFSAHVGPEFTIAEFRRATATASLSSVNAREADATMLQWSVIGVDAAFDDDAGRVQFQFDLEVRVDPGTGGARAGIGGVGFQVVILATAAP